MSGKPHKSMMSRQSGQASNGGDFLGMVIPNVTGPGNVDVAMREAATQKNLHHRIEGRNQSAERFSLRDCGLAAENPYLEKQVAGAGVPLIGPSACLHPNARVMKYERALHQQSVMDRDEYDQDARTATAASAGLPSRMTLATSFGPSRRLGGYKVAMVSRGGDRSDPILGSADHAPAYVDIAGRYARAHREATELTARHMAFKFNQMSGMVLGGLSSAELNQLSGQ